jgi:integrase
VGPYTFEADRIEPVKRRETLLVVIATTRVRHGPHASAFRCGGVAGGWCANHAVADLLGHSSIAITGDIYGHISDAATRSAVDGLSYTLGL